VKKVLIFGADSYIGASFERYAQGRLDVATVSSIGGEWKETDFSTYDSIVCVAGIAHRARSKENKELYFSVNRDLAVAAAQKAKAEGARQFVYFSSIYAYGVKKGEISSVTTPAHRKGDCYGLSKYQAEALIEPMASEGFCVAIIRPPMVYGPGCKGNFPLLAKVAKTAPFLPTLRNKRSMIYIDNLAEFLALVIEQGSQGVFCPQNKDYVCTAKMMGEIAISIGKKDRRLPLLNPFLRLLMPMFPPLQSAFGNLCYSTEASKAPFCQDYQLVGFEDSIKRSVSGNE